MSGGSAAAASGPRVGVPLRCAMAAAAGVHVDLVALTSVRNASTGAVVRCARGDVVNTVRDCTAALNTLAPPNYDRRYLAAAVRDALAPRRGLVDADLAGFFINVSFTVPADPTAVDSGAADGSGEAAIASEQRSAAALVAVLAARLAGPLTNFSAFSFFLATDSGLNASAASLISSFAAPVVELPAARPIGAPAGPAARTWRDDQGIVAGVTIAVLVGAALLAGLVAAVALRAPACVARRAARKAAAAEVDASLTGVVLELPVIAAATGIAAAEVPRSPTTDVTIRSPEEAEPPAALPGTAPRGVL
jgi:hypothetical protein